MRANADRARFALLTLATAGFLLAMQLPVVAGLAEKATTSLVGVGDNFQPYDAAVGSDGLLYVVDHGQHDIDVFSPAPDSPTRNGIKLYEHTTSFSGTGQAEGLLYYPQGIAAGEGSIYVADTANRRVSQFSNDGGHIRSWGEEGSLDGQFLEPSRVAVDTNGNVFVSDGRRNDIQTFSSTGEFLSGFKAETPNGPLAKVGGVAIAPDGSIYVTDEIGDRVVKYDAAGNFQSELGEPGDLRNPVDIAVGKDGTIFVVCSHAENQTVQVYNASGAFEFAFGKGQFQFPKGVGLDADSGDVWVANTGAEEIDAFGSLQPRVRVVPEDHRSQFNGSDKTLKYTFEINQVKSCRVNGDATVTLPAPRRGSFTVDGEFSVNYRSFGYKKISLSKEQAAAGRAVLNAGKPIRVEAEFRISCPGEDRVVKRIEYKVRPD